VGQPLPTEKDGGAPFNTADEESTVILAAWAAIAIENARLYESVAARRDDLEQSRRRLEARNILTKLRLRDRLQVAVAAYEAGLVRSWRGPPQVNVASAPRCME